MCHLLPPGLLLEQLGALKPPGLRQRGAASGTPKQPSQLEQVTNERRFCNVCRAARPKDATERDARSRRLPLRGRSAPPRREPATRDSPHRSRDRAPRVVCAARAARGNAHAVRPHDAPAVVRAQVKVYTAVDDSLCLNMFRFGARAAEPGSLAGFGADASSATAAVASSTAAGAGAVADHMAYLEAAAAASDAPPAALEADRATLAAYIARCTPSYVETTRPERFCRHVAMHSQVHGNEGVGVEIHAAKPEDLETHGGAAGPAASAENAYWIISAASNVVPHVSLHKAMRLMKARGVDVARAHVDVVSGGGADDDDEVTMTRLLVTPPAGDAGFSGPDGAAFGELATELRALKWLDDAVIDLALPPAAGGGVDAASYEPPTLARAEVMVALASLAHAGVLAKRDAGLFTRAAVLGALSSNVRTAALASDVAGLLLARFAPDSALSDAAFTTQADALRAEVDTALLGVDAVAHATLCTMIDLVGKTMRTNFYLENRFALALRLNADVLAAPVAARARAPDADDHNGGAPCPYGVFFVHGRRFNAFHTRFRDIARGGMRLVTPPTREAHSFEAARHYDECYSLALAQQLKNKVKEVHDCVPNCNKTIP